MCSRPDISVVLPVFNEQENLRPLWGELRGVLSRLPGKSWEVLFVDDASTDASRNVLLELAEAHSGVRFMGLAENRGQSAAFFAGFQAAGGGVIITMDADMQNDPADIPAMLEMYSSGLDMVVGWRKERKDSWQKRIASRVGNGLRNWLLQESVHDSGCSLKILRADMARRLPAFRGMHRFLPGLMAMQGARIGEMPVSHRPRLHGASKYSSFGRAREGLADLLAVRWMRRRALTYEINEKR